jgi:hypothetical protein
MLIRRITTGACTLCLAIPAVAGASPATSPSDAARGSYPAIAAGPRGTVKANGLYPRNPPGPRSTVKARGPYGIVPPGPRMTTKGINAPLHQHVSTAGAVHVAGTSHRHGANGWRAAAVAEAALLAALALGCALVLPARRRPPRMVT